MCVCVFLQMKTVSVALVLCLNVGVDPPDVVKTSPCARLECWIGEYILPINKHIHEKIYFSIKIEVLLTYKFKFETGEGKKKSK